MTHDPLCPNIPEEWDPEASILWPARCHCELIAQVRENERDAAVQRVEALNWIIPEGRVGKWVVGYQTPGYPDQPPPNAGLLRTQTIAAIKGDHP